MKNTFGKAACLIALVLVQAGCAISRASFDAALPSRSANESFSPIAHQAEGYALLYDLVSKEQNVSKLLIIKRDSPPLKAVIQKVARESKQIAKELEQLARQNPPLNLKSTGLPVIEQKARELIEKEEGKGLLRATGQPFEFKLLLSQIEGLNYGSHLAAALVETETNAARRAFLQRTQTTLASLRDEIYQMILERYAR
ncbi:MAG: hypothetical protein ABIV39_09705 [Verrucomicrobiota bacterium]